MEDGDDRNDELESFVVMASKTDHEFRAYDGALDFVAGSRDAERRASTVAVLPKDERTSRGQFVKLQFDPNSPCCSFAPIRSRGWHCRP